MASTNKTDNLHLNKWIETDKPTRADFVSDNNIIDEVISTHIDSDSVHLRGIEKERVSNPYQFRFIQGTGESSRTVNLDISPKFVIYFMFDEAPVKVSSGTAVVNFGIAVNGNGGSGGCELSGNRLVLSQGTQNGVKYNLNESDTQYTIVGFI